MQCVCVQIVAYNKMDVPDSSDYWQDMRHSLEAAGVPSHLMCAISAATGQGVIDLVRLVHTALDELPAEVMSACLYMHIVKLQEHGDGESVCCPCTCSVCVMVANMHS